MPETYPSLEALLRSLPLIWESDDAYRRTIPSQQEQEQQQQQQQQVVTQTTPVQEQSPPLSPTSAAVDTTDPSSIQRSHLKLFNISDEVINEVMFFKYCVFVLSFLTSCLFVFIRLQRVVQE